MTRHLIENVHVAGRSFAAGDVPPAKYADQITNPKVWSDYEAAAPGEAPGAGPGEVAYDPADQSVDEVNNHLANADEDEVARVLALETTGKARKGILEGPYAPEGN